LEALEDRWLLSRIFTVNTTDDLPSHRRRTMSLRQAIIAVDRDAGSTSAAPDTIRFAIGSGPQTILVGRSGYGALPALTRPVIIDGTTQRGFTGRPLIELTPSSRRVPAGSDGLLLLGGSSAVKGLDVNRFSGAGIDIRRAGGDTLLSNFIGTDRTGTLSHGNGVGVLVNGVDNNTVSWNLISGNNSDGVRINGSGATGNIVEGNNIGVDGTGQRAVGNRGAGVLIINSASRTFIGNSSPNASGDGNTIAFNGGIGVDVESGVGNMILGNSIYSNTSGEILRNGSVGANNNQQPPALFAAVSATGVITGEVFNDRPNTEEVIELFASPGADSSGRVEGQTSLGLVVVTTDSNGVAHFTFNAGPGVFQTGQLISATATDLSTGSTSEFSNGVRSS
jgi:hypothetical protein